MSKPMKKGIKIVLIILIVLVLLAACFVCVAIYARNEFNKERSWLPQEFSPQQASVTELPDNAHDAYVYVMRLYGEAVQSDRTEGSWYTDVDLKGDVSLPFGDVDNSLIRELLDCDSTEDGDNTAKTVKALYPAANKVRLSDESAADPPAIDLKESDILTYSYDPESIFNRKGEYRSDTYEIVFKVDPAFEDEETIHQSSVYQSVCDTLKDAATVDKTDFETQEVEFRFRVDRLTDQLMSVEVYRSYRITADITMTDAYSAMLKDGDTKQATVILPYKETGHIDFMWYGLRFKEDYMEQKPDDIMTLPLEINVNSAAVQGKDFTVTYTVSDPETMTIDEDGVMTVNHMNDVSAAEGVKVTAVLQYDGKTYTDDITIYITNLDKTTTGVRFWKDSFTAAVGKTVALPADIRVPVNEQTEQRSEEEYTLLIEVSDPTALKVEQDLFATALKPTAEPVTVTVTMKCGGHTYTASIPVTITEEIVEDPAETPEEPVDVPVAGIEESAEIQNEITEETEVTDRGR